MCVVSYLIFDDERAIDRLSTLCHPIFQLQASVTSCFMPYVSKRTHECKGISAVEQNFTLHYPILYKTRANYH
ncbi:hypothetical protein SO802_004886 [Lithocarpus litseifolius]|uniref:Uncharacterized protein n=1 Tax=Lithocarpus litseifolius TaxID=425828 RepID=A0AAW2DJ91_9ROSI